MLVQEIFNGIIPPEHIGIAQILIDKGGGSYEAVSRSGYVLILTGTAQAGQMVFYDAGSNKITGEAPDLTMNDVPV